MRTIQKYEADGGQASCIGRSSWRADTRREEDHCWTELARQMGGSLAPLEEGYGEYHEWLANLTRADVWLRMSASTEAGCERRTFTPQSLLLATGSKLNVVSILRLRKSKKQRCHVASEDGAEVAPFPLAPSLLDLEPTFVVAELQYSSCLASKLLLYRFRR